MEHVTVVTAADVTATRYLRAAADSVRAVDLPDGVSLEWIVVVDTEDPAGRKMLTSAAEVADQVLVNPRRLGPGASRNRALAHATGSWVATLDADDLLAPDAVRIWADTWTAHGPRWQVHRTTDVDTDAPEVTSPWESGVVPAGRWADHLEQTGRHPLPPAAVLYPYDDLVRAGGWGASPIAEEVAPLLAVTTSSDGVHSHHLTHHTRQHPGQVSARVDLTALGVEATRLARTRAQLLRHR